MGSHADHGRRGAGAGRSPVAGAGPRSVTRLLAPPLSLYIHLPWCVRKCPYCDFNSHQAEHLPEAEYIAALERDLDRQLADRPEPRPLQSIFFGGGTPSLFSAPGIEAILNAVHRRMKLADDAEITLEANPGTAEQRRFRDYRSAGINRLSIGVQSFDDDLLRALGRIHDGEQARRAVHSALAAGLEHINIDLMHGLPGQTLPMALADLDQALALGTGHLSWYQLTTGPNRAFTAGRPGRPMKTTWPTSPTPAWSAWPARACSATRCPPTPARPDSAAATTSTTGASATTWGWAPGPTASSAASPSSASSATRAPACPPTTWPGPARPGRSTPWPRASASPSTCSMPCAWWKASPQRILNSAPAWPGAGFPPAWMNCAAAACSSPRGAGFAPLPAA